MNILVLNCGSSSIKYQLFAMPEGTVLARGLVERIGEAASRAKQQTARGELEVEEPVPDHSRAMAWILRSLTDDARGAIRDIGEIDACGHRVVHGGERFTASAVIDDELEAAIESFCDLAPLHNPPNLVGIREARKALGELPMVAVCDTAFHQSIPPHAYLYGLPYQLYEKFRIRRYGFHGTSHKYVTRRAAEILGTPLEETDLITCHLGNGCSLTAVRGGRSVDTSMGFTPLEGVMMGTRTGSFDPAVMLYLTQKGYTATELDRLVNKQSGLLGISGHSNDVRDLEEHAARGDRRARLALDMFAYSVRKCIGAYLAVLNGCRAIVMTGGIGENAVFMRRRILEHLESLGIVLDGRRNHDVIGSEGEISAVASHIRLLVIPTNEEQMIARETHDLVNQLDEA